MSEEAKKITDVLHLAQSFEISEDGSKVHVHLQGGGTKTFPNKGTPEQVREFFAKHKVEESTIIADTANLFEEAATATHAQKPKLNLSDPTVKSDILGAFEDAVRRGTLENSIGTDGKPFNIKTEHPVQRLTSDPDLQLQYYALLKLAANADSIMLRPTNYNQRLTLFTRYLRQSFATDDLSLDTNNTLPVMTLINAFEEILEKSSNKSFADTNTLLKIKDPGTPADFYDAMELKLSDKTSRELAEAIVTEQSPVERERLTAHYLMRASLNLRSLESMCRVREDWVKEHQAYKNAPINYKLAPMSANLEKPRKGQTDIYAEVREALTKKAEVNKDKERFFAPTIRNMSFSSLIPVYRRFNGSTKQTIAQQAAINYVVFRGIDSGYYKANPAGSLNYELDKKMANTGVDTLTGKKNPVTMGELEAGAEALKAQILDGSFIELYRPDGWQSFVIGALWKTTNGGKKTPTTTPTDAKAGIAGKIFGGIAVVAVAIGASIGLKSCDNDTKPEPISDKKPAATKVDAQTKAAAQAIKEQGSNAWQNGGKQEADRLKQEIEILRNGGTLNTPKATETPATAPYDQPAQRRPSDKGKSGAVTPEQKGTFASREQQKKIGITFVDSLVKTTPNNKIVRT